MAEKLVDTIEKEALDNALKEALSTGGEFAEVFIEDKTSNSISLDDARIDNLASSSDRGAGIRVTLGDMTGFAHTSDLSAASLVKAAGSAAKALGFGQSKTKAQELSYQPSPAQNVQTPHNKIEKAEKVELLRTANNSARQTASEISQVSARYSESFRRILIANSLGIYKDDAQTKTLFSVNCTASGDTGMQTGRETVGHTIGYELFNQYSVDELAATAAARASEKLKARPAPAGTWPVVIGPGSGGVMFHEACGHGLEADLVYKGASVFANRVGELVASPLVTLIDDGTMSKEWGTYQIDDEGHSATRNVLIQDGILVDYLWDAKTARKYNHTPSGNGRRQSYKHLPMVRMTNTYLTAGTSTPEEIIGSVDYGIYVAKLGGGQVDTASGDFVFGMVESYLIEGGKITAPLREGQLIGNGPKVLTQIEAVGNDFEMGPPGTCGKDGQGVPVGDGVPTLKVAELTIGGSA